MRRSESDGNGAVTGIADCFSVLNSIDDAAEVRFSAAIVRGCAEKVPGVFERTLDPAACSDMDTGITFGCLPSVFGTLKTIS